ncbi:MAG: hypothetical protein ACFE8P_16685 [Promethearchaeota archaeon]
MTFGLVDELDLDLTPKRTGDLDPPLFEILPPYIASKVIKLIFPLKVPYLRLEMGILMD